MPQELDVKLSIEEYLHTKEEFVQKGNLESLNSIWKAPDSKYNASTAKVRMTWILDAKQIRIRRFSLKSLQRMKT